MTGASSPRRLGRHAWRWALALAVLLCAAGIFQHDLWTADEPREAEIAREMLDAGFSAVPTLGGEPFLEKPPLHAWVTAAAYALLGVSAGAARVPAALFSIAALWAAFLLGRRAGGRVAGLCAVLVLATMAQFAQTSHKAVLDTALTAFVAAGHVAFLRLRSGGRGWDYVVVAACSGLAFLTKGWIGPGLTCAPPLLAAIAMRDRGYVGRVLPRAFAAAVAGVAILGLPWILALAHAPNGGWDSVEECLVTQYLGRTVGSAAGFTSGGHPHGPLYYLTAVPAVALPWTLAAAAMLKGGTLARTWRSGSARWCLLVFVAGVLLLSIPTGKREMYLAPLLPVLAVPFGVWLSRVGSRRGSPWDRGTLAAMDLVLVVSGLAVVYAGVGGPLPDSVAQKVAPAVALLGPARMWVLAAVGAGVAAIALSALPSLRRPVAGAAIRSSLAAVALFAAYHGVVRPVVDPMKELATGAAAAARLVPSGEPLLGLSLDETTIAVLPYYTGRMVADADDAAEALARLDAGPARHLIVLDRDVARDDVWRTAPTLRRRLRPVGEATMALDRVVRVFAYERP